MKTAADGAIRKYATQRDFTIVSKDTDFHQHSFLFGAPPKVIWIKLGNCPTSMVAELIRSHTSKIQEFVKDQHAALP
jgi:predicted nuclease of predicted toxin-antitoxin system